MPYATLTWEISTSDPSRHVQIADAVRRALRPFSPCGLLAGTVLLDTATRNMDDARDALDRVAARFPAEFFYHSVEHATTDILQGDYPPWAELDRAHAVTGSSSNPFDRSPAAVAATRRRGRRAPAKRKRRRGRG